MMKFRSVFDRWERHELGQLEAAELLGVGERTFRRWCGRYREGGEDGLADRRLGQAAGMPGSESWLVRAAVPPRVYRRARRVEPSAEQLAAFRRLGVELICQALSVVSVAGELG